MFQEKENKKILIGSDAVAPGEEKLLKNQYRQTPDRNAHRYTYLCIQCQKTGTNDVDTGRAAR